MQDPKSDISSSIALDPRDARMKSETNPRPGIFAYWPNRITAFRFVGALALFALFAFNVEDADPVQAGLFMSTAFWLFIVTSLSDWLDGYLARSQNVVTPFGRIADPFVDKVLVLGSMIFLATMPWSRDSFPAWIVVVILAREFLVTGIRGYIESVGKAFPADLFGKFKMVLQCLAIGFALGARAFHWPEALYDFIVASTDVLVWLTLLTTVGSGLSYVFKTQKILAES